MQYTQWYAYQIFRSDADEIKQAFFSTDQPDQFIRLDSLKFDDTHTFKNKKYKQKNDKSR